MPASTPRNRIGSCARITPQEELDERLHVQ
jgi:hypothetical protein